VIKVHLLQATALLLEAGAGHEDHGIDHRPIVPPPVSRKSNMNPRPTPARRKKKRILIISQHPWMLTVSTPQSLEKPERRLVRIKTVRDHVRAYSCSWLLCVQYNTPLTPTLVVKQAPLAKGFTMTPRVERVRSLR